MSATNMPLGVVSIPGFLSQDPVPPCAMTVPAHDDPRITRVADGSVHAVSDQAVARLHGAREREHVSE